jgi:hypothetical protein
MKKRIINKKHKIAREIKIELVLWNNSKGAKKIRIDENFMKWIKESTQIHTQSIRKTLLYKIIIFITGHTIK